MDISFAPSRAVIHTCERKWVHLSLFQHFPSAFGGLVVLLPPKSAQSHQRIPRQPADAGLARFFPRAAHPTLTARSPFSQPASLHIPPRCRASYRKSAFF